jgi:DNA-binding GntR family transcriptional regulator
MLSTPGPPRGAVPRLDRPGPLRERVYEALLELISTRVLPPGRHLVESELAGRLGVSRQPVREVLQRLNTEGWVDLRPAQGAYVHQPTDEEADQLLAVRTLLETEAARLAALHAGPAGVSELRRLVDEGYRAVDAGDADAAVALNGRFHGAVMELSGNKVLAELAGQAYRRARWCCGPLAGQHGRESWAEHEELTAAVAARDEERAARLMRAHSERTRREFLARGRG